jgi:hypothetical protein
MRPFGHVTKIGCAILRTLIKVALRLLAQAIGILRRMLYSTRRAIGGNREGTGAYTSSGRGLVKNPFTAFVLRAVPPSLGEDGVRCKPVTEEVCLDNTGDTGLGRAA